MRPIMRKPDSRYVRLIPLAIFAVALVVRMAFVWQATDSPYWRVPLVDASTYDTLAKQINGEGWLAPLAYSGHPFTPYFQPPLYPLFLALIYRLLGLTMTSAVFIQYLIGSVCCVLTYLLGRRYFSHRVGVVAGFAMALTATQIYYEGRLLPPVLIIVLNLAVLLFAAKQSEHPALWRWPVIGILAGLSAITRPDILLFVPLLLVWMWIERAKVIPRRPVLCAVTLMLGVLLPVSFTGVRNRIVGRDFELISSNGGVNFYVGNDPDIDKTLGIRPGIGWDILMHEPVVRTGSMKPSDWDRYFYRKAFGLMNEHRSATLLNFVRKGIWVWSGQEIRRNEDEYYLTRVSSVYRALLWRVGSFGFPFGVIAPFGLLGLVVCFRRRRDLFLPYAYIVTQALMLIAYFPCSRYRAALVPVLLIFGAAAALELFSRKPFRQVIPLAGLLLAFGMLSTLLRPGFEGATAQIEADNCWMLGIAHFFEKHPDKSIAVFEEGLRLDPTNPDLHNWLALDYYGQHDFASAEVHALECIRLAPDYGPAYPMLADIYRDAGKPDKAAEVLKIIRANRKRWGIGDSAVPGR